METIDSMAQTNAEKQMNYRQRMRLRGYVEVSEWVPAADKDALRQLCRAARDEYLADGEPAGGGPHIEVSTWDEG